MSHPAWTTLAGGATGGAGMGHTAGQVAASVGRDAVHHPVGALVSAAVIGAGVLLTRGRRRRGARRPPESAPAGWGRGETLTFWVLTGLAGAIVWLVAGAVQKPKPATVHVTVPQPKVTHTTIVQHVTHVTHVTQAAATHIPDGLWWVAGISVVAVLVIFLNRRR